MCQSSENCTFPTEVNMFSNLKKGKHIKNNRALINPKQYEINSLTDATIDYVDTHRTELNEMLTQMFFEITSETD